MAKLYECHNAACSLGHAGAPGLFTGGISQEQVLMLTGQPDADHGDGVCPNCGHKGKPSKEKH